MGIVWILLSFQDASYPLKLCRVLLYIVDWGTQVEVCVEERPWKAMISGLFERSDCHIWGSHLVGKKWRHASKEWTEGSRAQDIYTGRGLKRKGKQKRVEVSTILSKKTSVPFLSRIDHKEMFCFLRFEDIISLLARTATLRPVSTGGTPPKKLTNRRQSRKRRRCESGRPREIDFEISMWKRKRPPS